MRLFWEQAYYYTSEGDPKALNQPILTLYIPSYFNLTDK